MLGLHYQTFGTPLKRSGCVWLKALTNADNLQADWFQSIRDMTGRFVTPVRAKKLLLDQFSIQWDAMPDHQVAMYLVTLQKRLVFIGLTSEDPSLHDFPSKEDIYKPLEPMIDTSS